MITRRRALSRVFALVATLPLMPIAQADEFPSRPIRIVVPAPPGGSIDTLTRLLIKSIQAQRNVSIVVDYKTGASGSIGVSSVVQAPPDGYTLLMTVPDAVTVYPHLKKAPPYDLKDLLPIARIASTYYVFTVPAASDIRTVKDLVAASKVRKLSYASQGTGSSGHLVSEMLLQRTGAELLHVPYRGAPPAILSVVTNETQLTNASPANVKPHIESGKLRAIVTTRATRSDELPAVPTMAESGYPDFVATAWFGLLAPAAIPPAVADKLNEMVMAGVSSPEFQKQLIAFGLQPDPLSRDAFTRFLVVESAKWKKIIQDSKLPQED